MSPLDFSTEEFDPQNLEHWLLVVSFIGLSAYGFWLTGKKEDKPTHRYNRETGKVGRNED